MPPRSAPVSCDEDSDYTSSTRGPLHGKPKTSGACVDCKSVKVRCEFVTGERKCRRCQAKHLPCQPRERKKRKAAETHEQLLERSHEQSLQILNLLQQYDALQSEHKASAWVGHAPPGLVEPNPTMKWLYKGKSPESAALSYFAPVEFSSQAAVPEIVKHCTLYPEEICELFNAYFHHIQPYFAILDPAYHTAQNLIWRSPFLFTVICATASRYHTSRPGLYDLAMEFARDLAGQALVEGNQSVDICQAYLVLAVYPMPARRWAEDKSWLLTGVAIRMALELGLNSPPPPSGADRESLNRARTWLHCYFVDATHAIQFGKTPMIPANDLLVQQSKHWYKSSSLNLPYDIHLCNCINVLVRAVRWHRHLNSTDGGAPEDLEELVKEGLAAQESITREMDRWTEACAEELAVMPLALSTYRHHATHMTAAALRLATLLPLFQRLDADQLDASSEVFKLSIDAARAVIQIALERLYPTGFLRYSPETDFLNITFAASFLIQLFQPRYRQALTDSIQREIVSLVTQLVSHLGSTAAGLGPRHPSILHSRFIGTLAARYNVSFKKPSRVGTKVEMHSSSSAPLKSSHMVASGTRGDQDPYMMALGFDSEFSIDDFMKSLPSQPGSEVLEMSWDPWQGEKQAWYATMA